MLYHSNYCSYQLSSEKLLLWVVIDIEIFYWSKRRKQEIEEVSSPSRTYTPRVLLPRLRDHLGKRMERGCVWSQGNSDFLVHQGVYTHSHTHTHTHTHTHICVYVCIWAAQIGLDGLLKLGDTKFHGEQDKYGQNTYKEIKELTKPASWVFWFAIFSISISLCIAKF